MAVATRKHPEVDELVVKMFDADVLIEHIFDHRPITVVDGEDAAFAMRTDHIAITEGDPAHEGAPGLKPDLENIAGAVVVAGAALHQDVLDIVPEISVPVAGVGIFRNRLDHHAVVIVAQEAVFHGNPSATADIDSIGGNIPADLVHAAHHDIRTITEHQRPHRRTNGGDAGDHEVIAAIEDQQPAQVKRERTAIDDAMSGDAAPLCARRPHPAAQDGTTLDVQAFTIGQHHFAKLMDLSGGESTHAAGIRCRLGRGERLDEQVKRLPSRNLYRDLARRFQL